MPSQTDVQQLIQGLGSGAVNNGNPNTIYNTPATVANPAPQSAPQPRNPAWAQNMPPIPQSTADGQWMLPTQWQAPATTPIQLPTWNINWTPLPGMTPPAQGGGTTPPTTGGGTTPPPTGAVTTGGNKGPGVPNTTTSPTGGGIPTPDTFEKFVGDMGGAMGNPGSNDWNRNKEWYNATVQSLGGAKRQDGSWDFREIIDIVSEPLVGANVWLSGSEKWDASNAIAGVVQSLTGIPVGNIMNMLGQWQATQNDPVDTPLEKILADHWEDNANNQVKAFEEVLVNYLDNWSSTKANQYINQNDNYLSNWNDIYNSTYVDNVLNGMSPEEASAKAKQTATATATNNPPAGTPQSGQTSGGRRVGEGVRVADPSGGCVTVDSVTETHERAGDIKVGDKMRSINAMDFSQDDVTVSYSEAKLRPCVRVTTSGGVVLECSVDAPIADDTGDQVPAKDLLGYSVPVYNNGIIEFETVLSVEDIGEKMVQHITCENNFFLAGKEKDKYLLHHNVKYMNSAGNRVTASGWQGSGSITPNGLKWGW